MTVCVGYLTTHGCWLGADSCAVRGGFLKRKVRKLIHRPGRLSFVAAGTFTLGEFVLEVLEALEVLEGPELRRPVRVRDVSKKLREACDAVGWKGADADGYELPNRNVQVLLTDGRTLVEFTNDLGVRYAEQGELIAIGSGSEVAIGAADAVRNYKPADRIVTAALDAACRHSSGCDFPREYVEVVPGPFELAP